MEPDVPLVIHIREVRYFAQELTIDVRRVLFGYKPLKELNLIDKDKVDKVLDVRRLPEYTDEEEEPLCHCIWCTKPCRKNLLLPGTEPVSRSWQCWKRECPHYYHIQDTVQFLEQITYVPKAYVEHPQPNLFPYIHRLRNTKVSTRRQVIYDFEYDNVSVYPPDVDGNVFKEGWHDQHYRDFQKYQDIDNAGILRKRLLNEITIERYFDRLQELINRDAATRQQVQNVTFKLLLAYGGSPSLLRGTEHLKKEYQVTVQDCTTHEQEYWQVRTIATRAPTTIVSDRYPYYYHQQYINEEYNPHRTVPTITYRDHTVPFHPKYRNTAEVEGLLPGFVNQLISN